MAALSVDGIPMPALPNSADQINYNNTTSGLSATTVKGAVDELASEKQDKSDNSLQTTDKTIPGAINELKSGLTKHAITFTANTGYTIEDQGSFVIGNVAYLNFFIKSETRITSRVDVATMSVGMLSGKIVAITCPASYVIDSQLNGYANVMIGVSGASTITVGDYVSLENGCAQVNVSCAVVIS